MCDNSGCEMENITPLRNYCKSITRESRLWIRQVYELWFLLFPMEDSLKEHKKKNDNESLIEIEAPVYASNISDHAIFRLRKKDSHLLTKPLPKGLLMELYQKCSRLSNITPNESGDGESSSSSTKITEEMMDVVCDMYEIYDGILLDLSLEFQYQVKALKEREKACVRKQVHGISCDETSMVRAKYHKWMEEGL